MTPNQYATQSNTIDGVIICEGCGRRGHLRSNCLFKTHIDFNHEGPWKDCETYKSLKAYLL